ncbi:protein kinase domain-containing protein [Aureispira anguillae]|uniref:non-specific serine/threonine protein kinase n=1 Tax=Aureispira anguillae TaxID=2864201 RepID=A0A916DQL1_9BACT|nr:hypothetical protein [Aureispira anguillae]BDS09762.1 hypothetical protein AsAng_0004670 [Aureispira anguillae]
MGLRIYTKKSKEKLKLNPKPFASGGEGLLYKIIAPLKYVNFVVKIYHPNKLTTTREEKINYLLKHPPLASNQQALVWVQDIVTDERGVFLGFIMPLVKGEKLEILCTPNLPKKLANSWYRFHPAAKDALDLRLKICYNLAAAIHQVHACERYILVDLKPDNVIINPEGLVALVDLDSVEVVENGYKLFDAPVATPEYTPPEYYKENKDYDPTQQQAWDRFSLAVIFYKLLMGVHPFAGTFQAPYDNTNTLAQKIEQGLFVHNPTLSKYKKSIPPPHQAFFGLGNELQGLFYDAFVEGSIQPALRPTAHAWCSAIMQHLDLHRFRVLPSKMVTMPVVHKALDLIYQQHFSPDVFLAGLTNTAPPISDLLEHPKYNLSVIKTLRKINLAILILGITYGCLSILVYNEVTMGYLVLFVCLLLSIVLLSLSFFDRKNNQKAYLIKISLADNKQFFQQQQGIFKGIKEHLDIFWKQLNSEYEKLFPLHLGNKKGNIQQTIERIQQELAQDLDRQDRTAQELIESETFEYTGLKEKYNRILHTHPSFSAATSLDAELSAIDFAQQQAMEVLQKTVGKALKNTQLEYDQLFEKDQRMLLREERMANKKIGQYKKHLALAQKQEEKKLLTKLQRQLLTDKAVVAKHIDTQLTLFKKEISTFLEQHNVTNLQQIIDIKPPGIVTLASGKRVNIAPLRYYQIHELLEWWMSIKSELIELPENLKEQITKRYDKDFQNYKKRIKKELSNIQKTTNNRKKSLQKKALTALKQLRAKNEPQILALKEKYKDQKAFLKKIFEERAQEEQEIHTRYQSKFDHVVQVAQEKVEQANLSIQASYQSNYISEKQLTTYKKNALKYDQGLKRLKEEYWRLQQSEQRYKRAAQNASTVDNIEFSLHLVQMFFIKPIN